jgi:RNA polymerase sigma-70 factor, ECF subfamily
MSATGRNGAAAGDEARRAADQAILEAARHDEPGSFDRFVERFGPMILAFGLRMCGHRQDAEDVFQETLVKVYTQLKSLEAPGALRTWLWRIVSNECLMSRRGPRDPSRAVAIDDFGPSASGTPSRELADLSGVSPEAAAMHSEKREQIEAALRNLPPDYRIIVLLRDFEGLTTEEVAGALGITESNAKVRLHRARMALRDQLSALFGAVARSEEQQP